MNRGDRHESICEDDQDRRRFLETLNDAYGKSGAAPTDIWEAAPGSGVSGKNDMLIEWIAEPLKMGTRGYLTWLLQQQRLQQPEDQRRLI
jgi:hypothetical protein